MGLVHVTNILYGRIHAGTKNCNERDTVSLERRLQHLLLNELPKKLRGSLIPGGGGFPETTNSPWVLSFRCGSLPPRPTDPDPCTQGPDGGRSRHDGRPPDEGTRDSPISVTRASPPGYRRRTSEHPPSGDISQGYRSPLGC